MNPNDPIYSSPVYQAIVSFLASDGWFAFANLVVCGWSTIVFFLYCFTKEGRDEHGKAIIGRACTNGLVVLVILINIYSQYTYTVISDVYIFANGLRLVYNGCMLTILISIAILREIR